MKFASTASEGFSSSEKLDLAGLELAKFKPANKLMTFTELSNDYVLVCYELISRTRGFDPLLMEHIEHHLQILTVHSGSIPLFDGLGPIGNHTLVAVPKDKWDYVRDNLGMSASIDRTKKFFCRPLLQQIEVIDTIVMGQLSTPMVLPRVNVFAFGLDSNTCCIHFVPVYDNKPPYLVYKITADTPFPETIKFANALFEENDKPFEVLGEHDESNCTSPPNHGS